MSNPRMVLVLDPNEGVRGVTCEWLQQHGHTVRAVATAQEAIPLLSDSSTRPAVLISHWLPGENGGADLQALMHLICEHEISVVIFHGLDNAEVFLASRELPLPRPVCIVPKPQMAGVNEAVTLLLCLREKPHSEAEGAP